MIVVRALGCCVVALAILASPSVSAQFAAAAVPTGLTDVGYMAAPGFLDVDEDGDLDLFVGRSDGTFAYFENTGSATAPAFSERAGALNPLDAFSLPGAATVGVGDVYGDGTKDIIAGGIDGSIYALLNGGPSASPQFQDAGDLPLGISNAATALADFDGDGDADILAGASDGTFTLVRNDGTRTIPGYVITSAVDNPLGGIGLGFSSAPTFADFDDDGDLDVIVGEVDGTLQIAYNTGGPDGPVAFGAFTDASAMGLTDVGYSAVPAVGDLDGDGDLDVLVGTSDGTFAYFTQGAAALTSSVTGTAGWRMLASPVGAATLDAVFDDDLFVQGIPGADLATGDPSLYRYDETVAGGADLGYVAPAAMTEATGSGVGYFAFVFEDDDPTASGIQGGFPKALDAPAGDLVTSLFEWGPTGAPLSYTDTGTPADDGWNLLGNPFAGWMDWDATAATGMNASAYVYDAASSAYLAHSRGVGGTLPGGIIGPFQGFWAQANSASPTLTADPSPSDGGPLYRAGEGPLLFAFSLASESGPERAQALLAFGVESAAEGMDAHDAKLLTPPADTYLVLGTHTAEGSLAIDVRDRGKGMREIDLDLARVQNGVDVGGPVRLAWTHPENLPSDWTATLLDRATNRETDLRDRDAIDIDLDGSNGITTTRRAGPALSHRSATSSRFTLRIGTGSAVSSDADAPRQLVVGQPSPNPAADHITLAVHLPEPAEVHVDAFDALGRRVAELANRSLSANHHRLALDLDGLGAGVYVLRVRVGDEVESRRLTVAR